MLCLNCIYAHSEVPSRVEVEIKTDEEVRIIDIAEELRKLWREVEKKNYTAIVFCDRLKVVKVGAPPSPAKTVMECTEFAEA